MLAAQQRLPGAADVVGMSVRTLARELGVAPNTAQRALRTLRAAGLVEHAQRRADGGRFDAATYRLVIPHDVLAVEAITELSDDSDHSSRSVDRAVTQPAPPLGQQLVLLPS